MAPDRSRAADRRTRVIEAGTALLVAGGREAVSTRAVSAGAGVHAPTIYRLFGDKEGLLDAVTSEVLERYFDEDRHREVTDDPVEDLRRGWDMHIEFGLANPAVYAIIYGDPGPHSSRPAAVASAQVLAGHVRRVAEAGRLRIGEADATRLLYAAGSGTVLTLLGLLGGHRDAGLSERAREAAVAAVTTDAPAVPGNGTVGAAVTLKAALAGTSVLSDAERALLSEWLDRIAEGA